MTRAHRAGARLHLGHRHRHRTAHGGAPSGLDDLCVILTPDGEDAWGRAQTPTGLLEPGAGELLARIQQAGIAAGGAVFPTHSKLDGRGQLTEILIVNGLECEPYITTDDRLMQEYADEIMDGIRVLKHLLKPKLTLIGVEDNKPAAIESLNRHATDPDVLVKSVPTKYPSGGAKQTIELLTGRQVAKGGRAVDMGIMVLNVATVFAIKRAIIDGEPLISRIVTLTGDAFKKPAMPGCASAPRCAGCCNASSCNRGGSAGHHGGPMMGFTLPHAMVPVVKATNCLLSPPGQSCRRPAQNRPASAAAPVPMLFPPPCCPRALLVQPGQGGRDKAEKLNLFDCIGAGPVPGSARARSPGAVLQDRQGRHPRGPCRGREGRAGQAALRGQAGPFRAGQGRAGARHAEAAAQRRQAMTAAGKDPVAAALARLKAKQETAQAGTSEPAPDNGAMIAAREARKQEALARRAAKATGPLMAWRAAPSRSIPRRRPWLPPSPAPRPKSRPGAVGGDAVSETTQGHRDEAPHRS